MGLYDTFVVKGKELSCPHCGRSLMVETDGERWTDFQTKCLDGALHTFEIDQDLPRFLSGLKIVEGEIPVYTLCSECGEGIRAFVVVKDGKFVDVRYLTVEEENELCEVSFGTSYGKHYYEYLPEEVFIPTWDDLHGLGVTVLYATRSKRDADAFLIGYAKRIKEEHPDEIDVYYDVNNRFHFGGYTYGVVHYKGIYFVVESVSRWRYPCPRCGNEARVSYILQKKPRDSYEMEVRCSLCNQIYNVSVTTQPKENPQNTSKPKRKGKKKVTEGKGRKK